MKKIAFFTEGQSELIFVCRLIEIIFIDREINVECVDLNNENSDSNSNFDCLTNINFPNPEIHFLIINCGSDDGVISNIKSQANKMFEKNFDYILGLRDVGYKQFIKLCYNNQRPNKINNVVVADYINQKLDLIRRINGSGRIHLHFEVMEFEAWLLSMHSLFPKIDETLTIENIQQAIDCDLSNIHPEEIFLKPASVFRNILALANIPYGKHWDELRGIMSYIEQTDIIECLNRQNCQYFNLFYNDLNNISRTG